MELTLVYFLATMLVYTIHVVRYGREESTIIISMILALPIMLLYLVYFILR